MTTPLEPGDFYMEDGKMVLTERYHLRRGLCCGSGCRHCPYQHERVAPAVRKTLTPPWPFYQGEEK
ncbi:MAG: DUF5522 domain-containing protein [Vulcanimicrobiota bacterium]